MILMSKHTRLNVPKQTYPRWVWLLLIYAVVSKLESSHISLLLLHSWRVGCQLAIHSLMYVATVKRNVIWNY